MENDKKGKKKADDIDINKLMRKETDQIPFRPSHQFIFDAAEDS